MVDWVVRKARVQVGAVRVSTGVHLEELRGVPHVLGRGSVRRIALGGSSRSEASNRPRDHRRASPSRRQRRRRRPPRARKYERQKQPRHRHPTHGSARPQPSLQPTLQNPAGPDRQERDHRDRSECWQRMEHRPHILPNSEAGGKRPRGWSRDGLLGGGAAKAPPAFLVGPLRLPVSSDGTARRYPSPSRIRRRRTSVGSRAAPGRLNTWYSTAGTPSSRTPTNPLGTGQKSFTTASPKPYRAN